MNARIMKSAGFTKELERVKLGLCPFCAKEINVGEFRDALSAKEHKISGLCQKCQDSVFGGPNDE